MLSIGITKTARRSRGAPSRTAARKSSPHSISILLYQSWASARAPRTAALPRKAASRLGQ